MRTWKSESGLVELRGWELWNDIQSTTKMLEQPVHSFKLYHSFTPLSFNVMANTNILTARIAEAAATVGSSQARVVALAQIPGAYSANAAIAPDSQLN